ncbi:3-oxoacyl-ACP reductase FabG [Telmatospirillum sp.]|uniref:SDR family NAD(P)-dependent oxidoreductase n=1 Tax=Telmatospirillum sp. TaxID=2079197 RepID=UPI002841023C|nr:3-oxoacyl-ACP reductase FabG [Telmatospirillum sp.]MDR3439392.1 3-oxoacyl-ACP reductase FabG [Telmatospirillum sp.]
MKDVTDHIAIVTGGTRGIGAAIVKRLAARGAAVVANSISEEAAETFADGLRAEGLRVVAACGDVADETDVARIFEICRQTFGPCSLLVNNAGYEQRVAFDSLSVADWDRMINVHLRGTFLCCRTAITDMLAAGDGVIVNVASRIGQAGGANVCHYAAAKAGMIGLTKSLAREFSRRGIRVNAVAPGPIKTEISAAFAPGWEEERLKELPLGRFGEPDDVADTVEFLASPRSRLYVGQTFGLNSGGLMV